jgi:hypothetical protein
VLLNPRWQYGGVELIPAQSQAFLAFGQAFVDSFRNVHEALSAPGGWLHSVALQRRLDEVGFLPHMTMPWHIIEACSDTSRLSASIEEYYLENWTDIRRRIEVNLTLYDVDREAKDAFREGLIAHQHKCYRSVCRHLLAEIERVVLIEMGNNQLGTHLRTLSDLLGRAAGQLSITDIEPGPYFAFSLFQRLRDHLYKKVSTEDDRDRMTADSVPNRHAAIHGLVVYKSFKNSLNTVFMTDYVFQVISVTKRGTNQLAKF